MKGKHWSDCAIHNAPAYEAGECDCGGFIDKDRGFIDGTGPQSMDWEDGWIDREDGV